MTNRTEAILGRVEAKIEDIKTLWTFEASTEPADFLAGVVYQWGQTPLVRASREDLVKILVGTAAWCVAAIEKIEGRTS